MEELIKNIFPFITRKDLRYGNPANLELRITMHGQKSVDLNVRLVTRHGISDHRVQYTSTGAEQQATIKISDIPIFFMIENAASADDQGDIYVMAHLQLDGEVYHQMCSGFVYGRKSLSWPKSENMDMIPGKGNLATATSADPAAGAEITLTVPANHVWNLISLRATLVTDATAATRRAHFVITEAGGTIIDIIAGSSQTASLSRAYTVAQFGDTPTTADDNDIVSSMPNEIWLGPGSTIQTEVTNIEAGDNWGVMRALVFRYYQPD